ncbi:MAG TPA: hypothetical protein VGC42_15110 [Kofleriaceae bacterium]
MRSPMLGAVLGRFAVLRGIAADRRARLALGGAAAIVIALVASAAAPETWFVWAPLVLGVPHVLADLRYLLLGPYRLIALGRGDALLAGGLLATAVVATPVLGAAVVLGAVLRTPRCRGHAVAAAGALVYAGWASPVLTAYALLHGHNLVALGMLALVGRQRGVACGFAGGAFAVVALVLTGALDPILPMAALGRLSGYVLPDAALAAWPAAHCAHIALSFLFLQGVHYATWLRLIPAAARPHGGLRGFGASLRALERDCTAPVIAIVVGLALALPVLALTGDPAALRDRYVQLAGGHAYLELAVVMRWLAARR